MQKSLHVDGCMLSFLSGKYLGVEWLGNMECLTFKKLMNISIALIVFNIATSAEAPSFTYLTLVCSLFFQTVAILVGTQKYFIADLICTFSMTNDGDIFSCVYLLPFGEVSKPFPNFKN